MREVEGKRFFFEKKKQNTFIPLPGRELARRERRSHQFLGFAPLQVKTPYRIKFFCFFFSKKRSASLRPASLA